MFELDLLTQRGSLIKHYQTNEIELSCGCFLFRAAGALVVRKYLNLTNIKLFSDFTKHLPYCLSGLVKLIN